jgi:uncharacterized protein YoxC
MSLTEIALIVIAVSILILVLTLLPAIASFKRTTASVGSLSDMIQLELKPTLQELTAVLKEMKSVGGEVAGHTEDLNRFMTALGETGINLSTLNRTVGVVAGVISATSAWTVGAKVAGRYVIERYLKKRGGM